MDYFLLIQLTKNRYLEKSVCIYFIAVIVQNKNPKKKRFSLLCLALTK